jgi:hypothetical protein
LGANVSVLIPALLLVLVASLPARPGLRFRSASLAGLLSIAGAAALLWYGIDRGPLWTDSFMSSVRKYAVNELREARERNVLLIDGASFVLNGVDTHYLDDELQKLGYSVRSVRLAAGGANHFERYTLNQEVVRGLGPKGDGQRWVYLAEVHHWYDQVPLAQFSDHEDTERVLHYLSPLNAWYAARALDSPDVRPPSSAGWRWPVLRHALLNAFNVGVSSRLAQEAEIEPSSGRTGNPRRAYRRFRSLEPLMAYARAPREASPPPLPWLRRIRERRLMSLWKPYVDELVYFGVPATRVGPLRYVQDFCRGTRRKCIAPTDRQLLGQLDAKTHWRDANHLRRSGAELYSRWLARKLHRLKVLAR